jgi:hypothetical protein
MHRTLLCFIAFSALVVISARASEATKNLVVNGNMEEVADGKPAKWVTGASEGGKVELRSNTENPKEGKRCLQMKGNADWAVAFSEKIPIERKKTYTLTGFTRAKSGTAYIKIDYYQGDKYLEGYTPSEEVSANTWTKLTVTSELDRHPEATHILAVAVASGDFDACFDDFVVTAK